jgi:hypothetical protein
MLPKFIKLSTKKYSTLWIRVDQIQAISESKIWMIDGTYFDGLLTNLEDVEKTLRFLAEKEKE